MMKERGNILFLILLAVVLFAALSYAVTRDQSGQEKNGSKESAQAIASAVSQYMTLVRNEIQRLMLVNDCGITNIDWRANKFKRFDNGPIDTDAPINPKTGCALFIEYGGNLQQQNFETYQEPGYSQNYIDHSGTQGLRPLNFAFRWGNRINEGTTANDVVMVANGLRNDACAYLLNPNNPPSSFPTESYDISNPAATTISLLINSNRIGVDPVNQNGTFFARQYTYNGATYCSFGMVLVPR